MAHQQQQTSYVLVEDSNGGYLMKKSNIVPTWRRPFFFEGILKFTFDHINKEL